MRFPAFPVLLLSFCLASAAAVAQGFSRVSFKPDQDAVVGALHLRLEEPDNPKEPLLWQGPLMIQHGKTHCQVEASLIQDVYVSIAWKTLIVVSISGSNTFVQFFRTSDCGAAWPQMKAFSEGVEVEATYLTMQPGCTFAPLGERPATCTAGSIYRLSAIRPPHRLTKESDAFNRCLLGKAFTGTMTIADAPNATVPHCSHLKR